MSVKVAINGFGRIGRLVLRAITESGRDDIKVVAVNDLTSVATNAHLLKYDSVHGRFPGDITVTGDSLNINGNMVKVSAERNPADLPWRNLDVDIVMECTGIFTDADKAAQHLGAGAKKVLISAPAKGDNVPTIVYGVNHETLTANDNIVSNASCTTNCLAPLVKVINDSAGIETGFMTTVHSYTGDQPVLDTVHGDLYRARAAAMSQIPTTTGAAKAIGKVIPELKGKLDGSSIRVPTPNVSCVDLKLVTKRATTVEEVNKTIVDAAEGYLRGIMAVVDVPLVSIDFNHDSASSTIALDQTRVMEQKFVRVLSWYDNEWGFANRMVDTSSFMARYL